MNHLLPVAKIQAKPKWLGPRQVTSVSDVLAAMQTPCWLLFCSS